MKYAATFLVLLTAAALGVLHWIDMVNFWDLSTGFVEMGQTWWRYAAMGGAFLLFALAGLMAAKRPRCLVRYNLPLGSCAALCGVLWAVVSGFELAALMDGYDLMTVVSGALYALTSFWFFLMAFSSLTSHLDTPSGSAWVGVLGTLSFYLLAVNRFGAKPASLSRLPVAVTVISALAALLFAGAAVRALYLPFTPCGRRLSIFGMTAFFFCTCLELPQSLCLWMGGYMEKDALLLSLALGCTGLMGGLCALQAAGPEADASVFGE